MGSAPIDTQTSPHDEESAFARMAPGSRIGDFELRERLGRGAMGEVFRAVDKKLGREVALKALWPSLAADEEHLKRFENEAKFLASLSHPNIAQLYDLREHEGVCFLVLELARGETLGERLKRGPLPWADAARIFAQVAEALEAAHEVNITHRDLKPENIKIDALGKVKVLDFGLAKYIQQGPFSVSEGDSVHPTEPSDLTRPGVIVGTPSYMSPEQARGEEVDKRTDIWAFGCCLFEALTGTPPFKDENMSDTLANVLNREPDWKLIPADVPPAIAFLLRRCLAKDKRSRLRDIGDGIHELENATGVWPLSLPGAHGLFRGAPARRVVRATIAAGALVAILAGIGLGLSGWLRPEAPPPPDNVTLAMPLVPNQRMDTTPRSIVLSPDGRRVVYAAREDGTTRLYVRPMDALTAAPLPGTEGAKAPFFSPDAEWIGFFAQRALKKVSVRGGLPVTLFADVPAGHGGAWHPNGTIVFNRYWDHGLYTIDESGGEIEVLTETDAAAGEIGHWWPRVLPGGKALLFTRYSGHYDNPVLEALTLDTSGGLQARDRHVVLRGAVDPRYNPAGQLVFARDNTLHVARFDVQTLSATSHPVPVLNKVRMGRAGRNGLFDLAPNGTLVYAPSLPSPVKAHLVTVDRNGDVLSTLPTPAADYAYPRYSSDGRYIAVRVATGTDRQIHLYDRERRVFKRLTHVGTSNFLPVWNGRDTHVLFASDREGLDRIYRVPIDAHAPADLVLNDPATVMPGSSTRDGRYLAYMRQDQDSLEDIYILDQFSDRDPEPFVITPFHDAGPAFSPSGDWIAYTSDISGRWQVYARPYPPREDGKVLQISSDGGMEPVWSKDGKELYFRSGDKMMAVSFVDGDPPAVGEPVVLFEQRYRQEWNLVPEYDVHDGEFLMVTSPNATEYLIVSLNWIDGLRDSGRIAPATAASRAGEA